jgi:hypothetical protein
MGPFVPLGSGLIAPIGLTFGPDGNLYVSSNSTNRVLRYNGTTGAFIDTFISRPNLGPTGLLFRTENTFKNIAIWPNHGGNAGQVSAQLIYKGLQPGATVKLTAPAKADIVGEDPQVFDYINTQLMRTTFDLRRAPPGPRDVVITQPDGSTITRPNAFTVEEGGSPQIWVDIIGRDAVRVGQPQIIQVHVANTGEVDAGGIPVWIEVPKDVDIELVRELTPVQPLPGQAPIDERDVPHVLEMGDSKLVPLVVPYLPAGSSVSIPVRVVVSALTEAFDMAAWINPPWLNDFSTLAAQGDSDALKCLAGVTLTGLGLFGSPGAVAVAAWISVIDASVTLAREAWRSTLEKDVQVISTMSAAATIAVALLEEGDLTKVFRGASAILGLYDNCVEVAIKLMERRHRVRPVLAYDPNEIVGPPGFEDVRWLAGEEPLNYAVFFENLPAATAPAQDVVITDDLDWTNLDLSSFSLGAITFADKVVTPITGVSPLSGGREFTAMVDLRPENNLLVKITASLDAVTGRLTWSFNSLDPVTGGPPSDPLAGFLPPGVGGSCLFTIMPKKGLPTGTAIDNQASIIFDFNAPIDTNVWLNTLDNDRPVSQVQPLPATQSSLSFLVRWTASDVGSGGRDFTIHVSDSGGPFTPWLTNTTDGSATFTGQPGHTYAFYSVARDNVYNVEDAPTTPDAVTRIEGVDTATDVTAQINITRGGFRLNQATGRYVQEVTLTNTSGAAIAGPVSLVLDGLGAGVTLFGQSGVTTALAPLGSPYINVNTLNPGAPVNLVLEFTNPGNAAIQYRARVLAGAGSR